MNARVVFPVWALAAWGLTVALVMQLLGGTFDTRNCQSDCVWAIYWVVFVVTVVGCAFGSWRVLKADGDKSVPTIISVGALFLLLAIFLTTMAIGIFG